jgi:S-DNA-T family DNA segregation ATPase FtsK/SpoIIIE
MRVTLAVLEGKDSGQMFRVERPSIVIGRGEGDIQLDDAEVSRRHVRLTVHGTRAVLHDLGSTNGTFVEETKVSEAALENRAEFRVGATRMMLILSEVADGAAAGEGTGGGGS